MHFGFVAKFCPQTTIGLDRGHWAGQGSLDKIKNEFRGRHFTADVMLWAVPCNSQSAILLVAGFPFYRPGRVDQESKIEGMRRYGSDLQNILRKRSQVFG